MNNTAGFHVKFQEYIDENFWIVPYKDHLKLDCYDGGLTIFERNILKIFDQATVSKLLYLANPTEYTKLFEEWILSNLIDKGEV